MVNAEWVALMERVLKTLGEVSPDDIVHAKFTVVAQSFAAPSDEAPTPNDGRPKIFTLIVTTRG